MGLLDKLKDLFVDEVKEDVKSLTPEKNKKEPVKTEVKDKKKYFSRKKKTSKDTKTDNKKVNK